MTTHRHKDAVAPLPGRSSVSAVSSIELTKEEVNRYRRHLVLPEVGREGQRRLKDAQVLLVGAGGLGSPLGLYLAAAGVGRIGIVDFDVVDETNLQRQILHGTRDVGRSKLDSARDRLADLNPHVQIDTHEVRLCKDNALEIFEPYDIIIDGTDNFPTRFLVNDACVLLHKPNVYGSIFRFEGQASVFWAERGPCYRCVYPEPPPPGLVPSCAEGGVLGVLPGVIGAIQAIEAVKLILGRGQPLIGRLLMFDALKMRFREFTLRRDPDCPICGTQPSITQLQDYDMFCGILPLEDAQRNVEEITARDLWHRLQSGDRLFLLDVREPNELWEELGYIEGAYLIPIRSLPERIDEIEPYRDWEIVVVCASGWRSEVAVRYLSEHGFKKPINLTGGMVDWDEEGLPFVRATEGALPDLLRRRKT